MTIEEMQKIEKQERNYVIASADTFMDQGRKRIEREYGNYVVSLEIFRENRDSMGFAVLQHFSPEDVELALQLYNWL